MLITGSKVRLARSSDEPEILHLLKLMHAEGGLRPLDVECAREEFANAFESKGGVLAVIGAPGHVRAMLYLKITRDWYTRDNHLQELFCWVHPDHRNSDYHKLLIEYAKWCSDDISSSMGKKVPLFMSVLTNRRMTAKVRLYRRFFGWPVGAFFVHNATWATKDDVSEEDFWHLPAIAKKLFRPTRAERRQQAEKRRIGV